MPELTIKLKTLTPVWTGGVDQQCDRLHETGLIGALRWWYEALVRGLGGYACDPTQNSPCQDKDHCAACELFGCTGWSRKFRLRVTDHAGALISAPLGKDTDFILRFVELREIPDEEKWLLQEALRVAADYGSIGRTRKPGSGGSAGECGIIRIERQPAVTCDQQAAERYVSDGNFRRRESTLTEWPNLLHFFFVQGASPQAHEVKKLTKSEPFLKGDLGKQEGRKVFPFGADGRRVWGYARDAAMRDRIITELRKQIGPNAKIKTGEEVIREL